MDIAVSAGETRDATDSQYREKGILTDVTHANPQLAGYH